MTATPSSVLPRAALARPRAEFAVRHAPRRQVDGSDLGTVALDPATFGVEPHRHVLHQVVTAQLAAARAGTQATRTRAEVRGGGAKPYRQKGIGRARQGSIRATQFVGGGIALGPKPRSYRQRTPKKMRRLALVSALSDRAAEERVMVVERFPWETPRTKDAVAALKALGLSGRVLAVLEPDDEVARRCFANLQAVHTISPGELNAYDVVRADWLLFTDATLPGSAEEAPENDGSSAEPPEGAVGAGAVREGEA